MIIIIILYIERSRGESVCERETQRERVERRVGEKERNNINFVS